VVRRVSVSTEADEVCRVALHGEIDADHAEAILAEIRGAIERYAPRTVTVDLSRVTFIDTSGLGTLVNAMNASRAAGADYRVTQVPDLVRPVLRITGLLEPFGLADEDPPA
jgi:anti-anti-sigma factor